MFCFVGITQIFWSIRSHSLLFFFLFFATFLRAFPKSIFQKLKCTFCERAHKICMENNFLFAFWVDCSVAAPVMGSIDENFLFVMEWKMSVRPVQCNIHMRRKNGYTPLMVATKTAKTFLYFSCKHNAQWKLRWMKKKTKAKQKKRQNWEKCK